MTNLIESLNSVNRSNVSTANTEDVKKLVKYVNGELLQEKPDTFVSTTKSAAKGSVVWVGLPFVQLLRRNKKLSGKMFTEAMKNLAKNNEAALVQLKAKEISLLDYVNYASESKDTLNAIKKAVKTEFQEKGFSKIFNCKQTIKKGIKKVTKPIVSSAPVKKAKAGLKALGRTIFKDTGKKVLEEGGKQAVEKSALRKLVKSSGAGAMLIFSGIIEGATEVLPTYRELGKEKGRKQLAKSAVKVTGDTIGFIAGEKIGTTAGLAAGTWVATKVAAATGTAICPGIGTAIGAVCGFIGGLLGSYVMGRVTKKITGKSEREKAKEAEQQKEIEQIAKNKEQMDELKEIAAQKIAGEIETTGTLSQNSQLALETLNKLEQENPFVS